MKHIFQSLDMAIVIFHFIFTHLSKRWRPYEHGQTRMIVHVQPEKNNGLHQNEIRWLDLEGRWEQF